MEKRIILIVGMVLVGFVFFISSQELTREDIMKKLEESGEPYAIGEEEQILKGVFSKEVVIKNAEISISTKNGQEQIEINFNKNGEMIEDDPLRQIEGEEVIVRYIGDGINRVVFNKKMNVVSAHIEGNSDGEYHTYAKINGYHISIPDGGILNFDGNVANIKVPDKGVLVPPTPVMEGVVIPITFEFEALEKGESFFISYLNYDVLEFQEGKLFLEYMIDTKRSVYTQGINAEQNLVENFFIRDKIKMDSMNIDPGFDELVIDFFGRYINKKYEGEKNLLIYTAYPDSPGTSLLTGCDVCFTYDDNMMASKTGYRLDIIKREGNPPVVVSFEEGSPVFPGVREFDFYKFTAGVGKEVKQGDSRISITTELEEQPRVYATGENTFFFDGDLLYEGFNEKTREYEIYRSSTFGGGFISEEGPKISVVPYSEVYLVEEVVVVNPQEENPEADKKYGFSRGEAYSVKESRFVYVVKGSKKYYEVYKETIGGSLKIPREKPGTAVYVESGPRVLVHGVREIFNPEDENQDNRIEIPEPPRGMGFGK